MTKMANWKPITDLPIGRQFVWAMGSHGESFPIIVWTDGTRFYPAFMDTPEKGAEPYADDTFARWLPLADLVPAHAGLVEAAMALLIANQIARAAEDDYQRHWQARTVRDEAAYLALGQAYEEARAAVAVCEEALRSALATAREA